MSLVIRGGLSIGIVRKQVSKEVRYSAGSSGAIISNKAGLSARSARCQIYYRAALASVEGFISGYSLRVGSAASLEQAGASVVDMQVAGRWRSADMPAHYAKAELAERGAVARYKEKETLVNAHTPFRESQICLYGVHKKGWGI